MLSDIDNNYHWEFDFCFTSMLILLEDASNEAKK